MLSNEIERTNQLTDYLTIVHHGAPRGAGGCVPRPPLGALLKEVAVKIERGTAEGQQLGTAMNQEAMIIRR